MRLILHGVLRQLYGPVAHFESDNVLDALEGFCTQATGTPKGLVVEVIGYSDIDSMKNSGPVEEIHLAPALAGGGGKFTGIIIGLIEIGIAFIPGIGTAIATALWIAGGTMVAMGVINLLMPAPTNSKSADPPASKYLGLNQNTVAIGTPQMLAYGRVRMAGQWLSLMSQSNSMAYGSFPI